MCTGITPCNYFLYSFQLTALRTACLCARPTLQKVTPILCLVHLICLVKFEYQSRKCTSSQHSSPLANSCQIAIFIISCLKEWNQSDPFLSLFQSWGDSFVITLLLFSVWNHWTIALTLRWILLRAPLIISLFQPDVNWLFFHQLWSVASCFLSSCAARLEFSPHLSNWISFVLGYHQLFSESHLLYYPPQWFTFEETLFLIIART